MQYGNLPRLLYFRAILPFKSYYVVWKLKSRCIVRRFQMRLNRTMQYGNEQRASLRVSKIFGLNRTMQYGNHRLLCIIEEYILFKSYYVVWKQNEQQQIRYLCACLNRTMQYGNWLRTCILYSGAFCLNRTMQYGNRES